MDDLMSFSNNQPANPNELLDQKVSPMELLDKINQKIINRWATATGSFIQDAKNLSDFNHEDIHQDDFLIWCSPTDFGVRKNLGKAGSRFAPAVILAQLKVMPNFAIQKNKIHVLQWPLDQSDQTTEWPMLATKTKKLPLAFNRMMHIGGGHDQVFWALKMALHRGVKNFWILNLDAHTDMRRDAELHSGTPFRQFYDQHASQIDHYHLMHYGVHEYLLDPHNLTLGEQQSGEQPSLPKNATVQLVHRLQKNRLKAIENFLMQMQEILAEQPHHRATENLFLISLDLDVLDGALTSAVSASNAFGLSKEEMMAVLDLVYAHTKDVKTINTMLGLYEYNPLFDHQQAPLGKWLAYVIYHYVIKS